MALYGGGNGPRRDAADRHSLRRRARIPPRPGEGGEWKVRAAGAARGQFRRREHGARARRRCAFHAQRELRLGVGALPDEHIREGGERVLRYAPGPAAAEARRQRPKPGRLRKERYLRRRARGIRQGGPRRRPARDERGRRDRFAWRHPRRDRLGARGAPGRSRGNPEIRRLFMKAGWVLLGALLAASVGAQEPPFPQKAPIEVTVLFPAGSSADVTARLLADGMSKQLGAKVIVFNRPGAGGGIGYKYVASQKADGYSPVWNSNAVSTTYHS